MGKFRREKTTIEKIKESKILKVILEDTVLKIILFSVVGYCLFAIIYYGFGIDDYLENKSIYKEAEELVSEKEYVEAVRMLREIPDFKDTGELQNEIYPIMLHKIDQYLSNENSPSSEEYISSMKYNLSLSGKERAELKERAEKLEKLQNIQLTEVREKLKYTDPYEGMPEADIEYSSWGSPTEIEYGRDYDAKSVDKRVKSFKWIHKDGQGRIDEIKTLMIKQGSVWGEPSISHYYVNQ